MRRQSLEEIRAKQQPIKSIPDAPPSKSPLHAKKQDRRKQLEDSKEECKLTGKKTVNRTTGQVNEEKACTVSVDATNKASAKKEYEDYRPVVALLDDCHAADNWRKRRPEQVMFGETLFRGYPFNSSGSDNPWIQRAHIEIDHPDKSRDVVVNIRPRMVLFNEKMSGGGILNGPVKQEILFQSIAGPVNVGITRGGPGTHKGLIWQGFDKKKDEFKLAQESKGTGKWKKWARTTRRLCGCSNVQSIPISSPQAPEASNRDICQHMPRVMCVGEVHSLKNRSKKEIESAMDAFEEHCIGAGFELQDKHAGDSNNWIDAGCTPRWNPISATVRHKKDPQEEWSVHAVHRRGWWPFVVKYSVDVHLESQRMSDGDKRIHMRITMRASSWVCLVDPLLRLTKFGSFVHDYCRKIPLILNDASNVIDADMETVAADLPHTPSSNVFVP